MIPLCRSAIDVYKRQPEGRMSQVVAVADGLREFLIEAQRFSYGPGKLGHLQGMGQTVPVMITFCHQKYLGFVFQPPESVSYTHLGQ